MNIGIVTPYYKDENTKQSGIANHFHVLTNALHAEGHNVFILNVRPRYKNEKTAKSTTELKGNHILFSRRVAMPKFLKNIIGNKWAWEEFYIQMMCMFITQIIIHKWIKKNRIEVIETTSYFSLCYFYMKFNPNFPLVVRVSTLFKQMLDDHYPFKSKLFDYFSSFEIKMIRNAQFLITHSKNHAREISQIVGVGAEKFTIISHGINLSYNIAKKKNEEIIILFVGRFEYRKGIDLLLDSIPNVYLGTNKKVKFILTGTDVNNEYEKKFISDNLPEVTSKVVFKGFVDNKSLEKLYEECDIFIAPSRYESFGLIFIEAMNYGIPVIGFPVGGVIDIIDHLENGLLAETGNVESLTENILLLIENEKLRIKMGLNARDKVELLYSKNSLYNNSISYYKSICIQ